MKTIFIILILLLFFVFSTVPHIGGVQTTGTFTPIPLSLTVDSPYPSNNSVNVVVNVTLRINCTSQQGYTMNISWYENSTGVWLLVQQNLSINNGTYTHSFVNSSNYSTRYWWKIAANDGMGNINNKTFCFTTQTIVPAITVTDIYPVDDSRNIPVQPTCYVTVNHTNGSIMNISWYFGTTVGSENILLGTDDNVSNSTQNVLCYPAAGRSTEYFWKIVINDGQGNWHNESFSFTTESLGGGMSRSNMALFAVAMLMGGTGIAVMFTMKRKRRRDGYKY